MAVGRAYSNTEIEDTTLVSPPAPPSTFAPRMDGSFMTSATVMLIVAHLVL